MQAASRAMILGGSVTTVSVHGRESDRLGAAGLRDREVL
jgi:hypothetical protein